MTYTQLAIAGVALAVVLDLFVLRTGMVRRRVFWVAYSIMLFFQILTNGVLTGLRIVRYDGDAIIGSSTPDSGPPPFIGDGRLVFAPVEDVLFGFALILITISFWIMLGRRGLEREPYSGPPIEALRKPLGSHAADGLGPASSNGADPRGSGD